MRILLITNTLAPYRVPLFNAIREQSDHEWVVLLETRRLAHCPWEDLSESLTMRHRFLFDASGVDRGWRGHLAMARATVRVLSDEQPDVVVLGGWSSFAVWAAWQRSRRVGRPVVLWSGVTAASVERPTRIRSWIRSLIIRTSDAHVAYSTAAAAFLRDHGAKADSIFIGPNVGDVDFYSHQARAHRCRRVASPGVVRLLYVGQLIPRKGIGEMLAALAALKREDWCLRIIGSGPLRESLADLIAELGLSQHVAFVDYLDRHGLAREYGQADIFLLPSRLEVGAIVNSEALASGLYCLVSPVDGVAPDLIDPGRSGEFVEFADTQACAAAIDRVLDRAKRGELDPERISRTASHFTPRRYATAFVNAVEHALGNRSRCEAVAPARRMMAEAPEVVSLERCDACPPCTYEES